MKVFVLIFCFLLGASSVTRAQEKLFFATNVREIPAQKIITVFDGMVLKWPVPSDTARYFQKAPGDASDYDIVLTVVKRAPAVVRIEAEKWTAASVAPIAARVEDHLTASPAYSNLGMTPLTGWTSYKLALPSDMSKARISWARNAAGTINVQLRAGNNATASANELLASLALTTTLDWQIYQPAPVIGFVPLSRPLKDGETLWITYSGIPEINIDWIELSR